MRRTLRKLSYRRARSLEAASGQEPSGNRPRQPWAAYTVLLVGLLLTGAAFYYVRQTVEAREHARFEQDVEATKRAVDRRMSTYVNATLDARGLFAASKSVERDEWHQYASGTRLESRYPGIQALCYASRVPQDKKSAYVRSVRDQGFRSFKVRPAGPRYEYFPITYIDPPGGANKKLFGYDPYANPISRAAMEQARDTGNPQVSGKVNLLARAGSSAQTGFLIVTPIYRKNMPQATVPERRDALQGFVVGVFKTDRLFGGILGENKKSRIIFKIYDGAELRPAYLLYAQGAPHNQDPSLSSLHELSTLEVAGRWWSLDFGALPDYVSAWQRNFSLLVLAGGIVLSLILFSVTRALTLSRAAAERSSAELEVANRELEATNRELETFSYSVSHDLRAPLRSISGFCQILLEDYSERFDEEGRSYLRRVQAASQHMGRLIDDLLDLSRVTRVPLRTQHVDLSALAREISMDLKSNEPEREVEFVIPDGLTATGDPGLLRVALENLLGNAWKFTSKKPEARIEFGALPRNGERTYFVRDNGAGFDMAYANKLFGAFQRLHLADEFEGIGIGLATVQRVIRRHGGSVWAEGEVDRGATFYFTLRE